MIWDFTGRRPLPVRDYEAPKEKGPKLWKLCVTELDRLKVRSEN